MTNASTVSRPRPTRHPSCVSAPSPSAKAALPSGVRQRPPTVGIQMSSTPSQQSSSSSSSAPCSPARPTAATEYDASIMHRVVPATLHDVHVKLDASSLDICMAFDVPLHLVNTHWITSRTAHCPDIIVHAVATAIATINTITNKDDEKDAQRQQQHEEEEEEEEEKEDDDDDVRAARPTCIYRKKGETASNLSNFSSGSSDTRGTRQLQQQRRPTQHHRMMGPPPRRLLPAETVAYRQLADALRAALQVVRAEQDEQDEIATSQYTTRQYRVRRQQQQQEQPLERLEQNDEKEDNDEGRNGQCDTTMPDDVAATGTTTTTTTTSATITATTTMMTTGVQRRRRGDDDMSVSTAATATTATTTDAAAVSVSSRGASSSFSSSSPTQQCDAHAWCNAARKSMACGYATTATHADIQLLHARRTIVKRGNGLYRAARAVSSCTHGDCDSMAYAEVVIDDARGEGGICVGVVPGDAALNTVIGVGTGSGISGKGRGMGMGCSAGLHCAGKMVINGKWTPSAVAEFGKKGDVVSIVVGPTTTTSTRLSSYDRSSGDGDGHANEHRREGSPLSSSAASDSDSNGGEDDTDVRMVGERERRRSNGRRRSDTPTIAPVAGGRNDIEGEGEDEDEEAAWTRVWFFVNGEYAGDTALRVDVDGDVDLDGDGHGLVQASSTAARQGLLWPTAGATTGAYNNGKSSNRKKRKRGRAGLFVATSLYRTGSQATLRCCARTWAYAGGVHAEVLRRVRVESAVVVNETWKWEQGGRRMAAVRLRSMCDDGGDGGANHGDVDVGMAEESGSFSGSGRCDRQEQAEEAGSQSGAVATAVGADAGVVAVCASVLTP